MGVWDSIKKRARAAVTIPGTNVAKEASRQSMASAERAGDVAKEATALAALPSETYRPTQQRLRQLGTDTDVLRRRVQHGEAAQMQAAQMGEAERLGSPSRGFAREIGGPGMLQETRAMRSRIADVAGPEAERAQARQMQAAQLGGSQYGGMQMQALQALQAQAQGQGPSLAQAQYAQTKEDIIAAQAAQQASARGRVNPALLARQGQTAAAQGIQRAGTEASMAQIAERQAAQQTLQGALGQAGAQELQRQATEAQLGQEASLANLQAGQQISLANQAAANQMAAMGYQGQLSTAQQQAALNQQTELANQQAANAMRVRGAELGLTARMAEAQAANQMQQFNIGQSTQVALANQQAANAFALQQGGFEQQAAMANQAAANQFQRDQWQAESGLLAQAAGLQGQQFSVEQAERMREIQALTNQANIGIGQAGAFTGAGQAAMAPGIAGMQLAGGLISAAAGPAAMLGVEAMRRSGGGAGAGGGAGGGGAAGGGGGGGGISL